MAHRAPEEPLEARIRQTAYYAGSLLLLILGVLQIWTGISAEQVADLSELITGVLTLLGGTAPAVAGFKVGTQIKTGTL